MTVCDRWSAVASISRSRPDPAAPVSSTTHGNRGRCDTAVADTCAHSGMTDVIQTLLGHSTPPRYESEQALKLYLKLREVDGMGYTFSITQDRDHRKPPEIRLVVGKARMLIESD